MSLSLSVLSQSGPPKTVGGVGGGRVVYHTSTGQYIGVATFFFLFFEPGVKLNEKSIENGLEGQKFLVVGLFWGGCHHPNSSVKLKYTSPYGMIVWVFSSKITSFDEMLRYYPNLSDWWDLRERLSGVMLSVLFRPGMSGSDDLIESRDCSMSRVQSVG